MEITGASEEFCDVYEHVEEEVMYVADGIVEVETDRRDRILLGAGESVFIASGVPHRWRRVGTEPARVVVVSTGTRPGA
jgi:quercetin dioxygenase-like cupin family protein